MRRHRLVERREQLGYTQEQLAERAGVSVDSISRWERGETTPPIRLRRALARALKIKPEDLPYLLASTPSSQHTANTNPTALDIPHPPFQALHPAPVTQPHHYVLHSSPQAPSSAASDLLAAQRLEYGQSVALMKNEVESAMQDRRRFLTLTGALLTTSLAGISAGQTAALLPVTDASSTTVLKWLEEEIPRLRQMDDYVAGEGLRQVVLGNVRIAVELLERAPLSEQEQLRGHMILAQLAQLGGWLSFDEGWHAAAQSLFTVSLRAASVAGDAGLQANALAGLSFQSTLTGHPSDGIQLALAGQKQAHQQPRRVRALLASRLARAYARHGEPAACQQALRQADDHLDAASEEDNGPAWIYYFDRAELQAQHGACWLDLRRPQRAINALHGALSTLGANYVRDGAIYRVRTAAAHYQLGDLDQTCTILTEAAHLTYQTNASRPLAGLHELRSRLNPRDPRVRDLNDRLHAIAGPQQG